MTDCSFVHHYSLAAELAQKAPVRLRQGFGGQALNPSVVAPV